MKAEANTPALAIRTASAADLDLVAALFNAYRQFYEQADDLPLARKFIRNRMANDGSAILVAQDADGMIGFCQMYPSFCSLHPGRIFVLSDLFVAPHARRRGVARALLGAAENYAIQRGAVRLELTTAKTNRQAQSVYESQGWLRDEIYFTYIRHLSAPDSPPR